MWVELSLGLTMGGLNVKASMMLLRGMGEAKTNDIGVGPATMASLYPTSTSGKKNGHTGMPTSEIN